MSKVLTIDDLVSELDSALQLASECQKPSAMIAATMAKAKLLGLYSQNIDHSSKDGSMTPVVNNFNGDAQAAAQAYQDIMGAK